mgnify:CR=1 FL=1
MLTLQKLKIYKKYKGNLDLLVLRKDKKDYNLIDDEDWYLIDSFIFMHLFIVFSFSEDIFEGTH